MSMGLAMGLAMPALADARSICGKLQNVIDLSDDLEQLMGPSVSDGSWRAEISVGGFDRCRLQLYEGRLVYVCYRRLPDAEDSTKAKGAFDALVDSLGACHPGWAVGVQSQGDMSVSGFRHPKLPLIVTTLLNRNTTFRIVDSVSVPERHWEITLLLARNPQ